MDTAIEYDNQKYIIYWLISKKHCEEAIQVLQIDCKIAHICKHYIEEKVDE